MDTTPTMVRLGVDVACRAAHQASLADATGTLIFSGRKFFTRPAELERLWAQLPDGAQVMVVMEPTRNAWVPLAAWFRARGAQVVLVPPEQSADLRDYYNKHTKTDRLDSRVLARLPLLHPDGELVELDNLGPTWAEVLGTGEYGKAVLAVLERYGDPRALKRAGRSRLTAMLIRHSRGAFREAKADQLLAAADETLTLWAAGGLDFAQLAEDLAGEARLARQLSEEITALEERIAALYHDVDPAGIVLSAPGLGVTLAAGILGRTGDLNRFRNLSGVRAYTGLVPKIDQSGTSHRHGPPTKKGDPGLREALYLATEQARKVDPTLAARYQRLIVEDGKHHVSAICTLAPVLMTRIAACWRNGERYILRDLDGHQITDAQGRAICRERYTVTAEQRHQRRQPTTAKQHKGRTDRRDQKSTEAAPAASPSRPKPTRKKDPIPA